MSIPYADHVLDAIEAGRGKIVEGTLGRHLHWGVWETDGFPDLSPEGFAAAQQNLCRRVYDAFNLAKGATVLDLGSGLGGTADYLDRQNLVSAVVACNIDSRQNHYAKNVFANSSVHWLSGDALTLPLGDGTAQGIVAIESLFHINDLHRTFAEIKRISTQGSKFVIVDFIWQKNPVVWAWHVIKNTPALLKVFGPVRMPLTFSGLSKRLSQSGFNVESVQDLTAQSKPTAHCVRSCLPVFGSSQKNMKTVIDFVETAVNRGWLTYQLWVCGLRT